MALTGATGGFVALEGLSMTEICFTYGQRRSAAGPDSLPNQEVKHRRLVFEPERGGSGRSIGRDRIGEVGLLPHAQAQLGLRAWVQLATRCVAAQQSNLSGPARINKPPQIWSFLQLLVHQMGLPGISTFVPMIQGIPYQTLANCYLVRLYSARGHLFSNLGP